MSAMEGGGEREREREREGERERQASQVEHEMVMDKGQGFEECFGVNDQIGLG